MKTCLSGVLLSSCLFTFLAASAEAADRVRPGQWDTTLNVGGRLMTRSTCLSQSDADEINGDAKSIKAYVDRVSAPTGCKAIDVKIDANRVVVSSTCASGQQNVGTTTYHGDSSDTVNTNGTGSQSKWVGACKQ